MDVPPALDHLVRQGLIKKDMVLGAHILASAAAVRMVCGWGGIASLAYEMAKHMPVQYESPVSKLVMGKGRVVGVQLEGDGSIKKAGHVIIATTPNAAAPLMLEEQRRFLESVLYVQYPMPIFFLDRPAHWQPRCEPGGLIQT